MRITGFATLAVICLSSFGPVTEARDKEFFHAVTESAQSLETIIQTFINKIVDPAVAELADRIRNINLHIDGIPEQERREARNALEDMLNAKRQLVIVRASLEALAEDTISTSKRLQYLIRGFDPIASDNTIIRRIEYTAKLLTNLLNRSVGLLSDANKKVEDIGNRINKVDATLTKLNQKLMSHVDPNSANFKEWVKDIRAKVYGGCAASIILGPLVAVCYGIAAGILESKIKSRKDAIDEQRRTVEAAISNLRPILKNLDEMQLEVDNEIKLIIRWNGVVTSIKDDLDDFPLVDMIQFEQKHVPIDLLGRLINVCQKYLDMGKK